MERLRDRAIEIINELHTERLDYESEYLPLIACANKCSEYEDTGLEPEKITATLNELSILSIAAHLLGVEPERLREPAQADKDRRCVALPSEDAVFRQALETYGPQAQTMMALEEMAELAKELCKASRGLGNVEHIAEEIADVQITLEQMIILHKCKGLVDRIRGEKVKRLQERLEKRTDRTATDAPGQRREKVGLP